MMLRADTGALIQNGYLTAGDPGAAGGELIVHIRANAEIAAAVVDHPGGPLALTISSYALPWQEWDSYWDPVLILSGVNTHSGPTTVNSARVAVDADARLGDAASDLVLFGGILQVTDTFTMNREVEVREGAAFEVASGEALTVAGVVRGDVTELHVRVLDLEEPILMQNLDPYAVRATLVLDADNTFQGDIIVGTAGAGRVTELVGTALAAGGPPLGSLVDAAVPTLQVSRDANFGDADKDVILGSGILHVTASLTADPERCFVVRGDGVFDVDEGQAFALAGPEQLEGYGQATKIGPGKMVVAAPNPYYWAREFLVLEGTLELRHPAALNAQAVGLEGGTLALRHDTQVTFPDHVRGRGLGRIDVDGAAAADPVLSIASLDLDDDSVLTVTGGRAYSLAVEGTTTLLGWGAGIDTQTADLALNGPLQTLNENGMLTKDGPRALDIRGPQYLHPGTWLSAVGGTTNIDTDSGGPGPTPAPNLLVEVRGSGTVVNFRHTQHLAGLALDEGGRANLTGGGTKTLVTGALDIGEDTGGVPQATLDLADNNLIVDYTGGTSPYADVAAWVVSGLRGGTNQYWDGPGITSSTAAAATLTALGVIDNQDTEPGIGGLTDLEGEPVPADAVIVKYTWWGDANLDGLVNSSDYDRIDANWLFQTPNPRWSMGDFNYDGIINSNDYDKIDAAWLLSGGAILADGAPVPTPEPATLALLALGGLALAARRKGD